MGNLASCVKHFAAYGASEAEVEITTPLIFQDLTYTNTTLKVIQKAIEAGARLVMTSFNIFEGVPATTNKYLLRDLLKKPMGL